jgi:GT2 family glycosyltransferase/glycosyltransferase involved in cell wall biosynthesis
LQHPPATAAAHPQQLAGDGVHLAIDLSQGSALTWVAGELAVALADIGQPVSIPRTRALSATLEERLRSRLSGLMTDRPFKSYHVKLNHYWPQFLMQEVAGDINAELFVTNYRFRGAIDPRDMWSRNLVTNGVRKLCLSSFCSDSLQDLGVPGSQCAVVAPGYSPEIESLPSRGEPLPTGPLRRLLVVTNSHDLHRYGTDILIPALARAFRPQDPVEIHIKDYGASAGSRELRNLIAAQPSFPRVVWHESFLRKADLMRLCSTMHLMVCPFRGEGYAMKILDAMAVGLPVMMPAFGGPQEYAPAGSFLPLDFDEVPVGECYDTQHYLVGPGAYWCQVHEESLVQSLRSYLSDPVSAHAAAAAARAHVFGRFTWRSAAASLVRALSSWRDDLDARRAHRRRPATVPVSVIIPTRDRPRELAKTLAGYAAQRDQSFEIVLVNDHGDGRAVREVAGSLAKDLRVRVIDNIGPPGPGAARNLALAEAKGEVFLVTGDDTVPAPDLIARHRAAHQRHPEVEAAFVGKVEWHAEMGQSWFTDHIVGAGAQQFDYRGLRDEQEVRFDQLYTSNVSWKRGLTQDLEQVFSESFRFAAYEDVELGYRLSKRGLKLRFLADAVGHHLHPMTIRSFLGRMRRVGNMRTVLAAMHPPLIGSDGLRFYEELEVARRCCPAPAGASEILPWESALEPLTATLERLDAWVASAKPLAGAAARQIRALEESVMATRLALFDELCETSLQIGQAEEWARGSSDQCWAMSWIATLRMAQMQRGSGGAVVAMEAPERLKDAPTRLPLLARVGNWIHGARRRLSGVPRRR